MLFEYDATQEKCPLPLLHMRKYLKRMNSGDQLVLLVSDVGSNGDIPKLLLKQSWRFKQRNLDNNVTEFIIFC